MSSNFGTCSITKELGEVLRKGIACVVNYINCLLQGSSSKTPVPKPN